MVTIVELLKKEKNIIDKLGDARKDAINEKQKSDLDEATLWINTDFKDKGLTNDKMRSAYVTQQKQLLFPNFYEQKKSYVNDLENELKFIRQTIEVMIRFDLKEIDFDLEEKDKDVRQSDSKEPRFATGSIYTDKG